MRRFAQLYALLDASTSTRHKLESLRTYWSEAPAADAAWAVYFLSGGRPRRSVSTTTLRQWAAHEAGVDDWLFEASYAVVGDLAETIAHLLPHGHQHDDTPLHRWMGERLLPWRALPQDEQLTRLSMWMRQLVPLERFVLLKMIGGGWRVGVSRQTVIRSLSEHAGLEPAVVAQRMMGYTDAQHRPTAATFEQLIDTVSLVNTGIQPYPFFLAHALEDETTTPVEDWQIEWKFDGVRAQVVRRAGQCGLWSRGEELLNEAFPDVLAQAQPWPDGTVMDGEIVVREPCTPLSGTGNPLPWDWRPAPFARLQTRLQRHQPGRALLNSTPATFVPYDLLEWQGQDLRQWPQHARRDKLNTVANALALEVSPALLANTWEDVAQWRAQARHAGLEGLMLKHRTSRYGLGRTRSEGLWLKWKLDPMTVDAVLIYAQAGHGRRANLYTDYTFAVWNRPPLDDAEVQSVLDAIAQRQPPVPGGLQLVTFAKAYSGLSDAELQAVDKVIRQTTVDRYGPVRSLLPSLVFEVAFEGINASPRHKSGVAVRFPRILRWRTDKGLKDADTLHNLQNLART